MHEVLIERSGNRPDQRWATPFAWHALAIAFFTGILGDEVLAEKCKPTNVSRPASIRAEYDVRHLADSIFDLWPEESAPPFIRAGAIVDINGVAEFCCLSSSDALAEATQSKIYGKLQNLRFEPASRNRETISVFVGMTLLNLSGESRSIEAIQLNRLESYQKLGFDYTAPQRQLRGDILPEGTPKITVIPGAVVREYSSRVWGVIETRVAEDGTASKSFIARHLLGPKGVLNIAAERMNDECFVPGRFRGRVQNMPYSEVFSRL